MQTFLENKELTVKDVHGMKPALIGMIVAVMMIQTLVPLLCAVFVVEVISFMMISLYTIPITPHSQMVLNRMTSKSNTILLTPVRMLVLKLQMFSQ